MLDCTHPCPRELPNLQDLSDPPAAPSRATWGLVSAVIVPAEFLTCHLLGGSSVPWVSLSLTWALEPDLCSSVLGACWGGVWGSKGPSFP